MQQTYGTTAGGPVAGDLTVGDYLPLFQALDEKARLNVLWNNIKGKPIILLFYPRHNLPACQSILRGFEQRYDALSDEAHVYAVSAESTEANAAAANAMSFRFPILTDQGLEIAKTYGASHNLSPSQDMLGQGAFTSFIADPNRQILQINRNVTDPDHAAAVLDFLRSQPREEPQLAGRFAPVLYLRKVFDPAFCERLITQFEDGGSVPTGVLRDDEAGDRSMQFNADKKVRRDHYIKDPALNDEISSLFARRVIPEIFKAFSYQVTRHEPFKIVRYDAEDGGHFYPHRDNNNLSGIHRRFAMTLNLNTGAYSGGCLRFPEYGSQLYRPELGDAVVFSCSLMHEATPVTEGQRYVLLTFLFGEEAQKMRDRKQSGLNVA